MLEKSKAEILYDELSGRIQKMNPGDRLMSVRQIMQEYEVSQLIVAQALSRLETDGKVVREPGKGVFVRDNTKASVIRIGFVVPDWPSPGIQDFEDLLKTQAAAFSCQVFRYAYAVGSGIHNSLPVKEFDALAMIPESNVFTPEFLCKINAAPIPVVLCGTFLRDVQVNCVMEDPFVAGVKAAAYLIKNGHRKLAVLVSEPRNCSVIEGRVEGFSLMAELNGCEVAVIDCQITSGDYAQDKTHKVMAAWLTANHVNFTALYAMSDPTAQAGMLALTESGIAIPERVSVLSADGLRQSAFYNPPLSAVAADYREQAAGIVRVILKALAHRGEYFREVIPSLPIERSSVRNLNKPK